MRRNRSSRPAGLVIIAWFALAFVARLDAADASDCPCINGGAGVCVRDPVCEAREREARDRLMHPDVSRIGPHNDAPTLARPSVPPVPQAPTETAHAPSFPAPAPMPPIAGHPVGAPARAQAAEPAKGRPDVLSDAISIGGRPRILETGYGVLSELGKEDSGYGLYSYAILPSDTPRSEIFLTELFKEIPSLGQTAAPRPQLNILYVLLQKDRERDFATLTQTSAANAEKMGADFARSFYDYKMAHALLDHVCNPPAESVRRLCEGDLSQGPYLFTYASPASNMSSVPPPFLFVDLSGVHEQAFGEFVAAFRAQVKRDDITDQARIRTLRLGVLSIVLTAADWVNPVEKALADIVHSPSEDDKK
jgi:hypothetical protein